VVNLNKQPLLASALLVKSQGASIIRDLNLNSEVPPSTGRLIDLTSLRSEVCPQLRRSLRHMMRSSSMSLHRQSATVVNQPPVDRPIRIRITRFDIDVDYRKLVPENRIPIGFWRCLTEAVFMCRMSRIDPFRRCCLTDLFRMCRRRRTANVSAAEPSNGEREIAATSGSSSTDQQPAEPTAQADGVQSPPPVEEKHRSLEEVIEFAMDDGRRRKTGNSRWEASFTPDKTTWINVCKLISLVFILMVAIPAPFCLRLAVYYVFEHDEVSRY
jgi:hypothetical protein